jgi:hypothetical protein
MTAIDQIFTATFQKEPGKGGRTYVAMADPAEYSGTRDLVRIRSRIDDLPFRGSFPAPGDGTHTLAVRADVRAQTGEQAGDAVTVHPGERIPPTPPRSAP